MSERPILSFELPKAVVVTGAASGLGQEICGLLLDNHVDTIGVDLSPGATDLVCREGYTHVAGSVAEQATWDRVNEALDATGASALGLVTSAAILDTGTVLDATADLIARTMSVNVTGTALGIRALLPRMVEAKGGAIVAVASVNASLAEQQLAIYNASKAAVRQLARTVALDHAREGVRVNVLSPGPMLAGLFKRHLESATDSDRFLAARANRQPIGRILEAREVAQAALFLLSSGATALQGSDIVADGGLTAGFDFRTGSEGASV